MTDKPRVRVPAGSQYTADGFQNVAARLGIDTDNVSSYSNYTLTSGTIVTRAPRTLEAMYRSSWIIGVAVDSVAEDMCAAGVDFGSSLEPDLVQQLTQDIMRLETWQKFGETKKWARLYGGSIGVIMIDGQDISTELSPDTIQKGQFKGIVPMDRWVLNPNTTNLVTDPGPDIGLPLYYDIMANAPAFRNKRVHHSRVIRMEGVKLPFYQRQVEQGWGMSVVERLYDRLVAFDSTTIGVAQLTYKAHLRTIKIKKLREILAAGGAMEGALIKQLEYIRKFQTSEGLTVIDGDDDMTHWTNTFSGLDNILMSFGQQISGAIQVPLVRLFGQSPAGLNSTGESDLATYHDGIFRLQETEFRNPVAKVLDLHHRNVTGKGLPDNFTFTFNHLSQMGAKEKAETAVQVTTAVVNAYESNVISQKTAMKELKQSSAETGIFTNITDEDIDAASDDIAEAPPEGEMPPGMEGMDLPGENKPDKSTEESKRSMFVTERDDKPESAREAA